MAAEVKDFLPHGCENHASGLLTAPVSETWSFKAPTVLSRCNSLKTQMGWEMMGKSLLYMEDKEQKPPPVFSQVTMLLQSGGSLFK